MYLVYTNIGQATSAVRISLIMGCAASTTAGTPLPAKVVDVKSDNLDDVNTDDHQKHRSVRLMKGGKVISYVFVLM